MLGFVLGLHSLVRWIVVIVGIVAVVRYALVMAGRAQPGGMDRGLMSGYTGLLDLNVLLGLILILSVGFTLPDTAHMITNIIGVAAAHIFARRAQRVEDSRLRARTNLLGVVISLAIIAVGVALVGGWTR